MAVCLGCCLLWGVSAVAAALPVGIAVSVEAVSASTDDDALRIKFTYTNITTHAITFVVYDTALEGAVRDDILDIRINGQRLPYVGPIFKRRAPLAQDYVTLDAGESRSATVVIDRAYHFNKSGMYSVRARQGPRAIARGDAVMLNVLRSRQLLKQAPAFQTCNATQQSQINSALSVAESYARRARDDLRDTPVNLRPEAERYGWWFGSYVESRWNKVQDAFNRIYSVTSGQTITFDCACDIPRRDSVYAFVYPSQHYDLYLCPVFWAAPTSGTNSKAGTIIHELSHFNVVSSTDDHKYGVDDCRALARSDPNRAVSNADSLEYFAENPGNRSMPSPSSGGEPADPMPEPEPEPDYSYLPAIILLLLHEL